MAMLAKRETKQEGWPLSELAALGSSVNLLNVLLFVILIASMIQGAARGASGSAKRLIWFVQDTALTLVSIYLGWKAASWLSPYLKRALVSMDIQVPMTQLHFFQQLYYTLITSLRDFSMFRFALLFLVAYALIRWLTALLWFAVSGYAGLFAQHDERSESVFIGKAFVSGAIGGVIGLLLGAVRALIVIAILFLYITLQPDGVFTGYIKSSSLYQQGVSRIIKPYTGTFIQRHLPMFTKAVEQQFQQILQRKYEIIDRNIPADVAKAAQQIAGGDRSDRAKAKSLYDWVGTRVRYDDEKLRLYEDQGQWHEQNPEETFHTRKGVCIDYSRLYAVMARSVGLKVKVVTGLGDDGKGNYGPHAWNEVYVSGKWIPLDTTWVSSGENWFNPPDFYKTHIKDSNQVTG